MNKFLIICAFIIYFCVNRIVEANLEEKFSHVKSFSDEINQTNAVKELLRRLLNDKASRFDLLVNFSLLENGKDVFKIYKDSSCEVVTIRGSSGVAVAWGLHFYLKKYCNCHISWEIRQLNLPHQMPNVNIKIIANDRFRYYQNVCTSSYSFVWWDETQWFEHIDWMAMNGINLPLAFNGQEYIWYMVYSSLNLTVKEIWEHFTGPGFLAWNRMGNLRGWAGPLNSTWLINQYTLQLKILKRMRSLGMTPVLPAFSGIVPRAFKRIFPNASLDLMTPWQKFDDQYISPYLVSPDDELFQIIGKLFLEKQTEHFGTNHLYNCDTFNEMTPSNGNLTYLEKIGKSIYKSMSQVDPNSIWIMQGWIFVNDPKFWDRDRTKALLTSIPIGKMIILDLQSEQFPKYELFDNYFGQPYIWCMLHNFGGTLGLLGSVDILNTEIKNARNMINSTMIGSGITMEGINQNYVIYDFMLEMFYRNESVNVTNWVENYALRRYGSLNDKVANAWNLLIKSVYNYKGIFNMRGKYTINRRPKLNIIPWNWYNTCYVTEAWETFVEESKNFKNSTGFRHDLVDFTRQVLQLLGDYYYEKTLNSYYLNQTNSFNLHKSIYLQLFDMMDEILASNEAFLLGKWLESAKNLGTTEWEKENYEYNARNQITLWGPKGEIVDYANKQWAGIVNDFFKPRWEYYLENLESTLVNQTCFNESKVIKKVFEIEQNFTFDKKIYSINAIGDSIEISKRIYLITKPLFNCSEINKFDEDDYFEAKKNFQPKVKVCRYGLYDLFNDFEYIMNIIFTKSSN